MSLGVCCSSYEESEQHRRHIHFQKSGDKKESDRDHHKFREINQDGSKLRRLVVLADDGNREDSPRKPSIEICCDLRYPMESVFEKPDGDYMEIGVHADKPYRCDVMIDVGANKITDRSPYHRGVPREDEDGASAIHQGKENGEGKNLDVVEEDE